LIVGGAPADFAAPPMGKYGFPSVQTLRRSMANAASMEATQ
jgi:hypothetical protein